MIKSRDTIYLFLLSILAICFFIINTPQDFGDVGLSIYTGAVALEKAHNVGGNVFEYFNKNPDKTFIYHTFGHPFSIFALHFFSKIAGLTPESLILLNIIIALCATFVAFYLGKMLYDSLFGFFFSFFLTVNVFYNVIFQTGTIYYSFCIPLALASFLAFLKLHEKQNNRIIIKLVISAVLFALSLFHVYSHAMFGFIFSFLFLAAFIIVRLFNKTFRKNEHINDVKFEFLSIRSYVLLAILIGLFYFGLTSFWEKYNSVPLGTVAGESFKQFKARSDTLPWESRYNRLPWLINSAFDLVFVDIDKGHFFAQYGVHSDTALTGSPALNFVEALFFVVGIVICLLRRKTFHLFCLGAGGFTVYLILFKFNAHAPRIYFFIIPILTMIASVTLREIFLAWRSKFIVFLMAILLLLMSGFNFMKIYEYRVYGGNKIWMNGFNQIYKFLEGNSTGNSLVVFANKDLATYAVLSNLLYVNGKFINTLYFKEGLSQNEEELSQKSYTDLRNWVRNALSRHDNIVFVFPADSYFQGNPGQIFGEFGMRRSFESFLKACGYPLPSIIIRSDTGVPLHYIYRFNRQWLDKKIIEIKAGGAIPELDSIYKIENLYANSPVSSISIKTGKDEWGKDFTFLVGGMDFNFSNSATKDGFVEYYPDFRILKAVEMNNFEIVKKQGLAWLESKQPINNLKYSFDFPSEIKITQVDIKTNPRIFNDTTFINSIAASYSVDNKSYYPLYRIRSNGNGRFGNYDGPSGGGDRQSYPFSGFNEYATYNVVYPKSNKLFLDFNFTNGFWSNNHVNLFADDKSNLLRFTLDLNKYIGQIPLISKKSTIDFSGPQADTLYLTLSKDITYSDIQNQLTLLGYSFGDDTYSTLARFQKENGIKAAQQLDNKTFEIIRDSYYATNAKKRLSIRLDGSGEKNVTHELLNNIPKGINKMNISYILMHYGANKKDSAKKLDNDEFADSYISGTILDRSERYAYDGKHSLMVGGSYNSGIVYSLNSRICKSFSNKEIEIGTWIKADVPNIASIVLDIFYGDGAIEQVYSDFHQGDGKWRKLKITKKVLQEPAKITISILNSSFKKDIMYVDRIAILVDGKDSSNYIPDNSFEYNLDDWKGSNKLADVLIEEIFTEELAQEVPKYWAIGGEPFFAGKENTAVYKDKASMRLNGNTISPYANLAISVQPRYTATLNGKTLKFTSYIRAQRAGIANLQMGITYEDGTYSEVVSGFHPGDDKWHEISLSKKFEKPVKAINLNIYNRGGNTDFIYIDNASCELDGKLIRELISNGDIEEWVEGNLYFITQKLVKKHLFRQIIQGDGYEALDKKIKLHDTTQSLNFALKIHNIKPEESMFFDSYVYFDDVGLVKPLDFVLFFDEMVKPLNLQRVLLNMGYTISDDNGSFSGTQAALREFQRDSHLTETGLIDEPTLKALFSP